MRLSNVDPKHPDDVCHRYLDWKHLDEDVTITASSWTASTGLTVDDDDIVTGSRKTRVTLSGGIEGADYDVANTVTTSDGQELTLVGVIQVRTKPS